MKQERLGVGEDKDANAQEFHPVSFSPDPVGSRKLREAWYLQMKEAAESRQRSSLPSNWRDRTLTNR